MSPKLPRVTAQELLRALRSDGWEVIRQSGSLIQLRHPNIEGMLADGEEIPTETQHPQALVVRVAA